MCCSSFIFVFDGEFWNAMSCCNDPILVNKSCTTSVPSTSFSLKKIMRTWKLYIWENSIGLQKGTLNKPVIICAAQGHECGFASFPPMIRCCKLIPNGLLFGDWFLAFFDLPEFPFWFPGGEIGDVCWEPNIPAKAPKAFLRLRKFGKSTNKDGLCLIWGFPQTLNCWESIIVISSEVSASLEFSSFQVWIILW